MPVARVPRCLGPDIGKAGAVAGTRTLPLAASTSGTPTRRRPLACDYPSPSLACAAPGPSSGPVSTCHQPQRTLSKLFSTSTAIRMPTYIVSCKDDATPEQVAAAKQHAKDQGGEIVHELDIIKGFSVKFPEDTVQTLEQHEHVKAVEKDGVAKIC